MSCIIRLFILTACSLGLAASNLLFAKSVAKRGEGLEKISSTHTEIHFTFTASEIDVSYDSEREGQVFNIGSSVSGSAPGQPDLPAIVQFVAIPPEGGVEAVVSQVEVRIVQDINPLVKRVDQVDGTDDTMEDNSLLRPISSEDCDASGFWPPQIVEVGRPAIFRGYRIAPLIIHPVRWNPRTRQAELVESADIKLNFQTAVNRHNLVLNPDRPRPSRHIRKLIESLVVNPEDLNRDEGGESGSIAYVIGRWNNVANALEPLIEWRRRMGWEVGIIQVNQNNDRVQVLNAIRNAYENWEVPPEYIVLVGDAPGMQGNNYTIAFFNQQAGARFAYETDHLYGCLEGDDLLPEAAVGRLVFDELDGLTVQVDKIINYESRPYLGANQNERGWQLRAATAATDSRSGKSSIDVCNWFEELLRNQGYQNIQELFWTANEPRPDPTVFLTNSINSGVSFVLYRGWTDMNGFEARDIPNRFRNGRMLPFIMLATCNTGEYATGNQNSQWCYTENFARLENAGAIGAVGAAGATHTAYNNILSAGFFRGLFEEEIRSQGWALMRSKLDLMRTYQGLGDINHEENENMEAWLTEYYIFNLMGDPAVELFTGLPQTMNVTHPQALRVGESWIQVQVRMQANDSPAVGAQVCLYRSDVFQKVLLTDENGFARFALDPAWTTAGTVQLTVTGPNLMTYMADLDVEAAPQFIGVGAVEVNDDNQGASRGDNDGVANPLEQVELNLQVVNYGTQRPNGEAYVLVRANTPDIQMVVDSLRLQSVPQAGRSTNLTFVAAIGGSVPHRTEAQFYVTVVVGQASWLTMFTLPIEAPDMVYSFMEYDNEPLVPGDTVEAYLELQNNGSRSSPRWTGVLTSLTPTVSVLDPRLAWREIDPGEAALSDDLFRLAASPWHIPGANARFELRIASENGMSDVVYFSVPVDRARAQQVFGPDNYGYMCLDNNDTGWVSIPRFEWVEISPRANGRGTNTGLDDTGEEDDASAYIQLPFNFRFYGQVFNDVTICTNGWMAFGDHRQLNSARNRRIPGGEVVSAMLCPFWDDLITTANGGIYYWNDVDQHRFIVEWSNMRKLGPNGNNEPLETFEVILYDARFYPSQTGDGDILFQYLDITDSRSCFQTWDTPYATVGIGSPDLKDGLEYTYWGQLHNGAAGLADSRAIKFTTLTTFNPGFAQGRVTDAATGDPLAGATITSSLGSHARTDNNGRYFLTGLPADDNYSFTASKLYYNDSTLTDIAIAEGDTTPVDFALRHPEFFLDRDSIAVATSADNLVQSEVQLTNRGNGFLFYTSSVINLEEHRTFGTAAEGAGSHIDGADELWDPLLWWPAGEIVNDNLILGVDYNGQEWFVSGGNSGADTNYFYIFDRYGEYQRRIRQPIFARYGIRDIKFYDGNLLCAFSQTALIIVDPEDGSIITRLEAPPQVQSLQSVTFDPTTGDIYGGSFSGGIFCMRRVGDNLVVTTRLDPRDPRDNNLIRPYGLAWNRDDEDGYPLYIYSNLDPANDANIPDVSLFKMNPATGEVRYLTNFCEAGEFVNSGCAGRGGICITSSWSGNATVLACVFDHPEGDRIGVFELAPNTNWLDYSPRSDTLQAGEQSTLEFVMDPSFLTEGQYQLGVEFNHNAFPGRSVLPLFLDVRTTITDPQNNGLSKQFKLASNYPNPFNAVTALSFDLPETGRIKLMVFDAAGRVVSEPLEGVFPAGQNRILFNAGKLPAGVYIYRLEWGERQALRKMVIVK